MEQRLSSSLDPFGSMATAIAVWAIVGVPVAAAIAALRVSVWVITSFPEMAATAAVLGVLNTTQLTGTAQRISCDP